MVEPLVYKGSSNATTVGIKGIQRASHNVATSRKVTNVGLHCVAKIKKYKRHAESAHTSRSKSTNMQVSRPFFPILDPERQAAAPFLSPSVLRISLYVTTSRCVTLLRCVTVRAIPYVPTVSARLNPLRTNGLRGCGDG